jgi:hypothetical protein
MYRVTEAQIEYILSDIKQRGVEMEDLQNNLLDHVCCMLEQNCKSEKDFETEYQKTIKQFFKTELWEIEEETILLLKYKHYYKMKRFLYILLFLSVSYNIFVFGRMGYNYYQHYQWMNEWRPLKEAKLQEGYDELVAKLKVENQEALKKNYLCIYFIPQPRSDYEKENYPSPLWEDAAFQQKQKLYVYKELMQMDSVARIYDKDVAFIFAYRRSDKAISKEKSVYKYLFKNVTCIDEQKTLLAGFCNENKSDDGFVNHLFILNKSGKVIYKCKYLTHQHIFVSRFLKKLLSGK